MQLSIILSGSSSLLPLRTSILLALRARSPLSLTPPNLLNPISRATIIHSPPTLSLAYPLLSSPPSKLVIDLGRTTPMSGTRPESRNIMTTISYWRDLPSLHAIALGPTHRAGWDWFNSIKTQNPHLGIFHEVYVVPRERYTNNYENCPIWGLGEWLFIFSFFFFLFFFGNEMG